MKTVEIEELGAIAEDVRNGETIRIVDGGKPVAEVVPMPPPKPKGKLPEDFFTRPRPKIPGVLDEVLRQRREGR